MHSSRLQDLVTLPDAGYVHYLAKKAEVAAKRQTVADLQEQIKEYERVLGELMDRYYAMVGSLQVRLERINLEIEEIKFRISWLLIKETQEGMEERLEEVFSDHREQVEADESETTGARAAYEEIREKEVLAPEVKKELRRLYRELAKRFHPDLADSEEDRVRRNRIMAEVNDAYEQEDLSALQEMLEQYEWVQAEARANTWQGKLEALDKEIGRLDNLQAELERKIEEIENSSAFELWENARRAAEQGYDLFDALCKGLEKEIEDRLEELAYQQSRYQETLGEHAGANTQ